MAKPTKLPRWADIGLVDPTTGINNVVEPSESRKDNGFSPSGSFPTRQEMNWLFNNIYQWIDWADTEILSGTVDCKLTTDFVTIEQAFTISWAKVNGLVSLVWPQVLGVSNSTDLEVSPDTSFPADILPSAIGGQISVPISVIINNSGVYLGSMAIKQDGTPFVFSIGAPLDSGGFTGSGTKGLNPGSVTYNVNND